VLKTNAAVKKVGGKLALPAIHRYFMIGQRMGCLIFNLSKDATIAIGGSSWLTVRWRGVLCFESLVFGFALFFSNVATSYNDSNQPEKIEKRAERRRQLQFLFILCYLDVLVLARVMQRRHIVAASSSAHICFCLQ
jgi:hypothetical protein